MTTIGEILVNLRLEAKAFNQGIKMGIEGGNQLSKAMEAVGNSSMKAGLIITGTSRNMFMFGITMKMFGIQVSRSAEKMMRDVTSSFTKIMESSGFMGSSIQQLGVHFEYLKFVIGSAINRALTPLMPYLISFINFLASVIQKHPKATLLILVGAFAFGKMLSFIGDIVLAGPQLIKLFMWLAGSSVWGTLASGAKSIGALATATWGWALANAVALLPLLLIGGAIALGVMLLAKMAEAMGGWGELGKSVIRGLLRLLVLLIEALLLVARTIANVVIGIFDTFFDFIVKGINWVIKQVNKLIESEFAQKVAGVMGVNLKTINYVQERDIPKVGGQFGDLMEKYLDWESKSAIAANPFMTEDKFNDNFMNGKNSGMGGGGASGSWGGGDTYNIDNITINKPEDLDEIMNLIKSNSKNSSY